MTAVIDKLPAALKKAYKIESSGNIMTAAGRIMYGAFYTPVPPSRSERDPMKKQWGGTLLFPACANLDALEWEINSIVAENLTEKKREKLPDGSLPYNFPLLKTAKIASLAAYAEEYPYCIRSNTKEHTKAGQKRPAPQVINAKGVEIAEEAEPDEVYNGRWARFSLNPYWYPANDGKPGVSLGLVNVQLLYNDDALAGGKPKASAEFEAVDIDDDEDEAGDFE